MGYAKKILSIEIAWSSNGFFLSQSKYALHLIHDAGLTNTTNASLLTFKGLHLTVEIFFLIQNSIDVQFKSFYTLAPHAHALISHF